MNSLDSPKREQIPERCASNDRQEKQNIVNKATESLKKVMSPQVKSGLPNDSLDAMRLDFMQDYNKVMQGTDLDMNSAIKKSGAISGNNNAPYFSGIKHSNLDDDNQKSPLS